MKNKRKNREAFAEHSYWQSYSDMMAALLLIFVLMIAITLSIYKQKTADLDKTSLELSEAQAKLDATMRIWKTPKLSWKSPTKNWHLL